MTFSLYIICMMYCLESQCVRVQACVALFTKFVRIRITSLFHPKRACARSHTHTHTHKRANSLSTGRSSEGPLQITWAGQGKRELLFTSTSSGLVFTHSIVNKAVGQQIIDKNSLRSRHMPEMILVVMHTPLATLWQFAFTH